MKRRIATCAVVVMLLVLGGLAPPEDGFKGAFALIEMKSGGFTALEGPRVATLAGRQYLVGRTIPVHELTNDEAFGGTTQWVPLDDVLRLAEIAKREDLQIAAQMRREAARMKAELDRMLRGSGHQDEAREGSVGHLAKRLRELSRLRNTLRLSEDDAAPVRARLMAAPVRPSDLSDDLGTLGELKREELISAEEHKMLKAKILEAVK